MTFKEATDGLFHRIDHASLASALDVSVATIRQARLREGASAFRAPPAEWKRGVIRLAERQIAHNRALIEALRAES